MKNKVVTREEWVKVRVALLRKEKDFTRLRDRMTQQIRELPWVKVEKQYWFEGSQGRESLGDLFGKCSQLLVYHFMLGPEWDQGCKSCSFWADNFQAIPIHLAHRDVSFVSISRAPFAKIEQFRKRLGWSFKWVSSFGSDFNFDFNVSFKPEEIEAGKAIYNYAPTSEVADEMPGVSVFFKERDNIFHTYSTFARGLDLLNGAYNYLDLVPKGRDEEPESTMSWLRHHDRYGS
jgi:predicted dithiol-disulfide oxidoreductase (DUF899 family)